VQFARRHIFCVLAAKPITCTERIAGAEEWQSHLQTRDVTAADAAGSAKCQGETVAEAGRGERVEWAKAVLDYMSNHTSIQIADERVFCMRARLAALQEQPRVALEQAQLCAQTAGAVTRLRTFVPALAAFCHSGTDRRAFQTRHAHNRCFCALRCRLPCPLDTLRHALVAEVQSAALERRLCHSSGSETAMKPAKFGGRLLAARPHNLVDVQSCQPHWLPPCFANARVVHRRAFRHLGYEKRPKGESSVQVTRTASLRRTKQSAPSARTSMT
jgi:hypothetical protein